MADGKYISMKEAQAILELGENTIRRLFDAEILGGFKTSKGHRRFLREDVVCYKNDHRDDSITFTSKE